MVYYSKNSQKYAKLTDLQQFARGLSQTNTSQAQTKSLFKKNNLISASLMYSPLHTRIKCEVLAGGWLAFFSLPCLPALPPALILPAGRKMESNFSACVSIRYEKYYKYTTNYWSTYDMYTYVYIYTAYILYISCSMDLYVLFERCPYLYLQHSLRRPLKLLLEVVSLSIDCTTSHAFCLAVPFIPAYMNSTCCATESISSFSVVNLRDPQTQQTRIGFFTHPPILSINIYIYYPLLSHLHKVWPPPFASSAPPQRTPSAAVVQPSAGPPQPHFELDEMLFQQKSKVWNLTSTATKCRFDFMFEQNSQRDSQMASCPSSTCFSHYDSLNLTQKLLWNSVPSLQGFCALRALWFRCLCTWPLVQWPTVMASVFWGNTFQQKRSRWEMFLHKGHPLWGASTNILINMETFFFTQGIHF